PRQTLFPYTTLFRSENDAARRAIYKEPKIELALDVEAFFDEQTLDDAASRAGLRSDEFHAEDMAGNVCRFIRRARELHATAFARSEEHTSELQSLRH